MIRVIFALVLAAGTAGAFTASVRGWGLTSMVQKPVSIRQGSTQPRGTSGPYLLYFGGAGRQRRGGGFAAGK